MSRPLALLLTARSLFTLAVGMQAVMLGWRVYEITGTSLHLGLVGLAEALPALSLALPAGLWVDRGRPLPVYRQVVAASGASAALMLGSLVMPAQTQAMQLGWLWAASALTGVARAFSQPAIYALVPQLVPRDTLPKAAAWMASTMQAARVLGPALGGLGAGWLGLAPTCAGVVALLGLGLLALMAIAAPASAPVAAREPPVQALVAGLRFVFAHPVLLPALLLDMLSVLFAGATALLPVFAAQVFAGDERVAGMLRAAPAVGAVLMGLVLARRPPTRAAGPLLLGSVAGFGLCMAAFGLSRSLPLSLALLALSGALDSISMVIRGAIVQLASPPAMRGRISAVNAMFIGSSNELGEFESGVAAWRLGLVPAVVGGGAACLLVVAWVSRRWPRLRRLDALDMPA